MFNLKIFYKTKFWKSNLLRFVLKLYPSQISYVCVFQPTLLVEMRTHVAWLKSTLLLKIKCFYTQIYMKTDCLQTNKTHHYLGKENAWEVDGVEERVGIN
jgi:hypothetical protein